MLKRFEILSRARDSPAELINDARTPWRCRSTCCSHQILAEVLLRLLAPSGATSSLGVGRGVASRSIDAEAANYAEEFFVDVRRNGERLGA